MSNYNEHVNFELRNFQRSDFETLWRIDQLCFEPGIAYSRRDLNQFIRQAGSFTLVAQNTIAQTKVDQAKIAQSKAAQNDPSAKLAPKANPHDLDPLILGFLIAEARRGIGHLITIDVLPEARRFGVGSKMLRAAEDHLLTGLCRRVYLETAVNNLSAIDFYKRHNYRAIQTVANYYANGLDALLLEKDLLSVRQAG